MHNDKNREIRSGMRFRPQWFVESSVTNRIANCILGPHLNQYVIENGFPSAMARKTAFTKSVVMKSTVSPPTPSAFRAAACARYANLDAERETPCTYQVAPIDFFAHKSIHILAVELLLAIFGAESEVRMGDFVQNSYGRAEPKASAHAGVEKRAFEANA